MKKERWAFPPLKLVINHLKFKNIIKKKGLFKRFIIISRQSQQAGKQMMALLNPKIIDKSKEVLDEYEGCLSIPK